MGVVEKIYHGIAVHCRLNLAHRVFEIVNGILEEIPTLVYYRNRIHHVRLGHSRQTHCAGNGLGTANGTKPYGEVDEVALAIQHLRALCHCHTHHTIVIVKIARFRKGLFKAEGVFRR